MANYSKVNIEGMKSVAQLMGSPVIDKLDTAAPKLEKPDMTQEQGFDALLNQKLDM